MNKSQETMASIFMIGFYILGSLAARHLPELSALAHLGIGFLVYLASWFFVGILNSPSARAAGKDKA